MSKRIKENLLKSIIYLSTIVTVGILVIIVGFVFGKGASKLDKNFFTNVYDQSTSYAKVEVIQSPQNSTEEGYVKEIGITIDQNENGEIIIDSLDSNSPVKTAIDRGDNTISLKKGFVITQVDDVKLDDMTVDEVIEVFNNNTAEIIELKVTNKGGGVFELIVTTLYMIGSTLLIAAPIGILAAIYLTEYAKAGKVVRLIRLATESLAGIPSIIYGLFGATFFVTTLQLGYSIIAGCLTVAIILLPVIIRTTEEALLAVPQSYREGSLGLGATKLQTIRKVVLPSAIPGILVSIILSIGRIVGESAALIFTIGTFAKIPDSLKDSGATLTIKAYAVAKETGDIETACAIGTVVILLIIFLNLLSKFITKKFDKTTV